MESLTNIRVWNFTEPPSLSSVGLISYIDMGRRVAEICISNESGVIRTFLISLVDTDHLHLDILSSWVVVDLCSLDILKDVYKKIHAKSLHQKIETMERESLSMLVDTINARIANGQ